MVAWCVLVGTSTFALVVITAYTVIAAVLGTHLAVHILRELDEGRENVLVLQSPRVEDGAEEPAPVDSGPKGL